MLPVSDSALDRRVAVASVCVGNMTCWLSGNGGGEVLRAML
jgi:hypothetical protein